MNQVETMEELIEEVTNTGKIGLIPTKDGLKVALVLDKNHPEKIFDTINELEVSFVKLATRGGPDMKLLEQLTELANNIRQAAVEQLKARGIDVNSLTNVPERFKTQD